jgi:hypothetical protein
MNGDPVVVLGGVAGRTFIETGLIAIRESRDRLFSHRKIQTDRDLLNNITIHHEWIHYVQSITCAAVHSAAQQMLQLSMAALKSAADGDVPDETHRRIRELAEELYGRRANEPFHIVDRPGSYVMMIPIPDSHQIGMLDLMEGVAVLESFKLCTKDAQVEHFCAFRDRYFPGSKRSPYRWSFDWLASEIGLNAAYELLGPVSFLALQTPDPGDQFVRIAKRLAKQKPFDYRDLANLDALAEFIHVGDLASWLNKFETGEPESGHVILDKCIAFAVNQIGVDALRQIGATPGRANEDSFDALRPPVIAYSGVGTVTAEVAPYARDKLYVAVRDWTAVVGAAERLTTSADIDVHQFCPHVRACPHFESGLCHRYFAPPPVKLTWDQCRFPRVVQQMAGLAPNELWATVGRERRSVSEVVRAFEATSEFDIWALVRRQRYSIVSWLGREGYEALEWKCKATADKALHALKTRKMDDLIEAKMFHGAVVSEVRNLARDAAEKVSDDGKTG